MSFLGNYLKGRPTEVSFSRITVIGYVKQLFRRAEFPGGICVALDDSAVVTKGDVVWPDIDCEHPFDFVPLPRIDLLIVNLPSKPEFLEKLGVETMEDVTPEAEAEFWEHFEFEFGEVADGVKILWE